MTGGLTPKNIDYITGKAPNSEGLFQHAMLDKVRKEERVGRGGGGGGRERVGREGVGRGGSRRSDEMHAIYILSFLYLQSHLAPCC